MDNYEFIDEELEDYTGIHQDFARVLSDFLNLPETFTFSLVTHMNPNSHLYKTLNKLAVTLNNKRIRNQHEVGRRAVEQMEKVEKERIIGPMTSSFLKEINECLANENIFLSEHEAKNIDDFLYLINANYFEELQERDPNVRREFLIKKLLYAISFYLNFESQDTFNDTDAQIVLGTCIFIPEDMKKRIIDEFRNSKVKSRNSNDYIIIRRDVSGGKKSYLEAKKYADEEVRLPNFDIDKMGDYIVLIEATEECKKYQNLGIGSAKDLSWDIGLIQKMMKLISTNHHDELVAIDEKCSNFNLVRGYIFATMVYAVSNNIADVTWDVAVDSLAHWDYLPCDLRKTIIDEMLASKKLDNSNYHYEMKTPDVCYQARKIIEFKPKSPKESD